MLNKDTAVTLVLFGKKSISLKPDICHQSWQLQVHEKDQFPSALPIMQKLI